MTGRLSGSLETLALFTLRTTFSLLMFTKAWRFVDLCVLFYTLIANMASATIETSKHRS